MDHYVAGRAIMLESIQESLPKGTEDSDLIKQIKEIIETRVRPAVAQDGGDIIFHSFEDGIVKLEMHGSCSGCPSSSVTLKNGIENMLKHYVPEVESVESV
jgi:Fe-S cluster biogenesis protein NfuA